jgi:hypothetical protein
VATLLPKAKSSSRRGTSTCCFSAQGAAMSSRLRRDRSCHATVRRWMCCSARRPALLAAMPWG